MGYGNRSRKIRKAMERGGEVKGWNRTGNKWTSRPRKMKGAHKAGMLAAVCVFGLILFGLIYFLSGTHMALNPPPPVNTTDPNYNPGMFYPKDDPDWEPTFRDGTRSWEDGDRADPAGNPRRVGAAP